jgi:ATP/maltotriose-dependent transcriptional regulator MalT
LYDIVPRERLFATLDEARQRPLIWVAGPPGAGKTALLASYIDVLKIRAIWYQIDEGDADVSTFFYYLSLATKPSRRKERRHLPLLTSEYLTDTPAYSRRYFRMLFDRLTPPTFLVLDNYHVLPGDSSFHALLARAAAEVPDGIQVVVIGRADPPIVYAPLDAGGGIARIGYDELRLTLSEAGEIARLRSTIDAPQLATLHAECDGWAAGMTLILERIRRSDGLTTINMADARESVFNYFAAQIFASATPRDTECLMKVALMPRMTRQMAQEMSGYSNAPALLENLYQGRLFTERRGNLYQFHDLFRAFLLSRFEQYYGEMGQAALRGQAAQILAKAGHSEQAIALLLEARDWQAAVKLIVECAYSLIAHGRTSTLRAWINQIPAHVAITNPWIDFWLGMSLIGVSPRDALEPLERAYHKFRSGTDKIGQIRAATSVLLANFFDYSRFESIDGWVHDLAALLATQPEFPSATIELSSYTALLLGQIHREPYKDLIEPTVKQIDRLMLSDIPADGKMLAAIAMLQYLSRSCDVDRVRQHIMMIESVIARAWVSPLHRMTWYVHVGRCWSIIFNPKSAQTAYEKAFALGNENSIALPALREWAHYGMAWSAARRGELDIAAAYLQKATTYLDDSRPADVFEGQTAWAILFLHRGDWDDALEAARRAYIAAKKVADLYFQAVACRHMALALIEKHRNDDAAAMLDEARQLLEGTVFARRLSGITYVQAYGALRRGDRPACHELLRTTLSNARRDQYPLQNAAHSGTLPPLLAEALTMHIEADFVCRVIRAGHIAPPDRDIEDWPWRFCVHTMGRFEVIRDGKSLEFVRKVPKKPLQLLKVLIALRGCNVPQQRVINILWPDSTGEEAQNLLGGDKVKSGVCRI